MAQEIEQNAGVQIFWTTYNETIKTHIKTIGVDIYAVMDRVRKGCHNEKYQPTKDWIQTSGHAPNETALVSMVSYLLPDLDQGSHWAPDSLRCNLAET